eukprot:gene12120-biopygen7871
MILRFGGGQTVIATIWSAKGHLRQFPKPNIRHTHTAGSTAAGIVAPPTASPFPAPPAAPPVRPAVPAVRRIVGRAASAARCDDASRTVAILEILGCGLWKNYYWAGPGPARPMAHREK